MAAKKPAPKKPAPKKPTADATKKAAPKKPAPKKPAVPAADAPIKVSAAPVVGSKAPAFTALDDAGNAVKLSDFAGKHVVLYFYPKDSTPGCTIEGQQFTRRASDFAQKNAVVFGVSADGAASHQKFKAKCGIGIPLLVDTDKALIAKYGAFGEKNMYGRIMMGIIRSTFLIGPDGKIKAAWPKVKVDGHADEVLAAIG